MQVDEIADESIIVLAAGICGSNKGITFVIADHMPERKMCQLGKASQGVCQRYTAWKAIENQFCKSVLNW